jgi:transglutaminase-like putative cysteine protease
MKYLSFALIIFVLVTASGCVNDHLISDAGYRQKVNASFSETQLLAGNRSEQLFSVFRNDLTSSQAEALKFLYAYMSLNDLADYTGDFFLANVDMSLKARDEAPWGRSVPDDIFLHYVLPVRVNNENLDSFRIACYDEIMTRIKDIRNPVDAALEINHWCHEKVNYQPSDSRTSAPLSTMLSAQGRCGEESTFTVAALRTAGIPARQVYVPRWAHTDDNHAWVEVWDNGKWYYMGACEPEPVIDRGWFTEPARRAMLVHTKAFGYYRGDEIVMDRHEKYAEINNLPKYADTKQIFVKTIDQKGMPVSNAIVEYQLYNCAEFYPLAAVPADENGVSTFITGLGDLLVWGRSEDNFDFRKISVQAVDTVILTLGSNFNPRSIDIDLEVPLTRSPLPGPSEELSESNNKRIESENALRSKYIESWISAAETAELTMRFGKDSSRVNRIIKKSMGNCGSIMKFMEHTPETLWPLAFSLLEVVTEKDLRDTRENILADHLSFCVPYAGNAGNDTLFIQYIMNPRISNEMLTAWRSPLLLNLPDKLKSAAPDSPDLIADWFNENIKIDDINNYSKTAITPIGVIELKVTDSRSRAICFVAACRSLGIPARLEPGSLVPQYWLGSSWNDVYFADQVKPGTQKGYIRFRSDDANPVPEYYTHFTIARFSNGRYNTLEYDYYRRINTFSEELQLDPGHYMMVTGNRLSDGKILASITFFDLMEGEHRLIDVSLRKDLSLPDISGTD